MSEKVIRELAEKAIQSKVFPGCVVGIRTEEGSEIFSFGTLAYGAETVSTDTIYDCASITKVMPTACLAEFFLNEKVLSSTALVKDYIPEFRNNVSDVLTIGHLLTYRVGGYALTPLASLTVKEFFQHIYTADFPDQPGGKFAYSNMPSLLLGMVLERIAGEVLHEVAARRIFQPLGLECTSMMKTAFVAAPSEIVNGEVLSGIVHDESARLCAQSGISVGHAGLFSNVPDLLKIVAFYFSHQADFKWWNFERDAFWMSDAPGLVGKTGFTGTSFVLDSSRKKACVILSNRTYPVRSTVDGITAFRRAIHEELFRA